MKHAKTAFIVAFLLLSSVVFVSGQDDQTSINLRSLRTAGKCADVFRISQDMLDKGSDDPSLYIERAECYRTENQKENAIAETLKAISSSKLNPRTYAEKADVILLSLDRDVSSRVASDFIKAGKLKSQAYQIRSRNHALKGEYKEALEDFVKALELRPTGSFFNMMGFAVSIQRTTNDPRAIEYYDFVFTEVSRMAQELSAELRDPDVNIHRWFEDRSRIKTYYIVLMHVVQSWIKKCDASGSIKCRNDGLEKMGTIPDPLAFATRAAVYRKYGMIKEAETDDRNFLLSQIDEVTNKLQLKIFEGSRASDLFQRGNLYLRTNEWDKAVFDFNEAMQLEPKLENRINETLNRYRSSKR